MNRTRGDLSGPFSSIIFSFSGESRRGLPGVCHHGHLLCAPRAHSLALLEDFCDSPKPIEDQISPEDQLTVPARQVPQGGQSVVGNSLHRSSLLQVAKRTEAKKLWGPSLWDRDGGRDCPAWPKGLPGGPRSGGQGAEKRTRRRRRPTPGEQRHWSERNGAPDQRKTGGHHVQRVRKH